MERRGKLNWPEALHFITQIMKGLGHAHSRSGAMAFTQICSRASGMSGAISRGLRGTALKCYGTAR